MNFQIFQNNYKIKMFDFMVDQSSYFWLFVINLFFLPFLFFRKYKSYYKLSLLNFFTVIAIIIILTVACFYMKPDDKSSSKTSLFCYDTFIMSIPITVFAMGSDHTLLDFSKEIHSRRKGVLFRSCFVTYVFLFFTYLYFGFLHYFRFG